MKIKVNEKQPSFNSIFEGWLFFLVQKFVLSRIIRIFTIVSAILEKRTEQEVELSSQFAVLLEKQFVDILCQA